jgi:hypothetical protein
MANLNDNDRQLIERYIDEELTIEETEAFVQRVQTDKIFAEEILAYQQAVAAIKSANRAQLKAQLQQHVQQKAPKSPRILRGWLVALAAAASFFVGWLVIGYPQPKSRSYEEAFQMYFQPANSGGIEKSTTTQLSTLDSAYLAYDNSNWQTALNLFNNIANPTPKTLYLKANTLIALNLSAQATPILYSLKNNAAFAERHEDVEWLIALCAMKTGDITPLQALSKTPTHLYVARAKELLITISK